MFKAFRDKIERFKQNEAGVTALYFGLAMPVFLGFAGLAFDSSLWFMERRILQNTVDAATLSAAYSKFNDGTDAQMLAAATSSAADNFFTVGGNNTLVVNSPPISGAYAGVSNYVQATMVTPADGFFSAAFGVEVMTISTTATAGLVTSGEGCLMALSESADSAMNLTGNATVDIGCAITSNSDSDEAIVYGGSVTIRAEPAMIADGDINNTGNGYDLDPETELWPDSGDSTDPHKELEIPTDDNIPGIETCLDTFGTGQATSTMAEAAANSSAVSVTGSGQSAVYTMNPGRYCGTIPFDSGGNIILNPGTYIIDAGNFEIGSQTNIEGNGVTIILTADDPANIGNAVINGGSVINLTGQTPAQLEANSTDTAHLDPAVIMGEYSGVLLYQDREAIYVSGGPDQNRINGGSDTYLSGAIYFPSQHLQYNGTSGTQGACVQIIGNTVEITGTNDTIIGSSNSDECKLLGLDMDLATLITLVE